MAHTELPDAVVRQADMAGPGKVPKPRYPITKALLAVNLVVFLLTWIAVKTWPNSDAVKWGADWGPLSLSGQWWRLLTATFLHFSLGHLLGNLLFLWILGKRLEPILGEWRFLFFYLSCGLAGSIAGVAVYPDLSRCGASGAVFGLAGGLIAAYGLNGLTLSNRARWKLVLLIVWTAFSVYPDASAPEVDNAAHAAGLLAGLGLGALLTSRLVTTTYRLRLVFSGTAALLLIAAISVRSYRRDVVSVGTAARYYQTQRWDDALRELKVVLTQKPDNVLANGLEAEVYLEKDDLDKAESVARRTLTIAPFNDRAINVLGTVEFRTGRCDEAYVLIGTIMMRGHHARPRFLWGDCNQVAAAARYLSEGNFDAAIQAYWNVLQEKPGDSEALSGLAKAYRAKGMWDEAKEAEALTVKPSKVLPPVNNLAEHKAK